MACCSNDLWQQEVRKEMVNNRGAQIVKNTVLVRLVMALIVLSSVLMQTGTAQNLVSDARIVGLGGAGDSNNNIASKLVGDQQTYRAIPIPLGLIQLFHNRQYFDPSDKQFDPLRAIEYGADPIHITLNRNSDVAGGLFASSLVKGQLNRDLNAFRGFNPSPEIKATGLVSPSFGKTFTVSGDKDRGVSHGVYIGAGPYITLGTDVTFDPNLIAIFSSPTPITKPNTTFKIGDTTTGQAAYAITGGYRARLALPGGLSKFGSAKKEKREGIFVAFNYHYIRGIHYDNADMALQFDTDAQGLVTLAPTTTPLAVTRTYSKSGNGMAMDIGTAIVTRHWDIGGGVDGIANRITWKVLAGRRYLLPSIAQIIPTTIPTSIPTTLPTVDFITTSFTPATAEQEVKLPVRYSANGGYHTGRWATMSEVARGLNGFNFGSGAEYYLGPLTFRGGGRYTRNLWHGATGLGLTIFKGLGVDLAAFQTSANIEKDRKISYVVSLRLGHVTK